MCLSLCGSVCPCVARVCRAVQTHAPRGCLRVCALSRPHACVLLCTRQGPGQRGMMCPTGQGVQLRRSVVCLRLRAGAGGGHNPSVTLGVVCGSVCRGTGPSPLPKQPHAMGWGFQEKSRESSLASGFLYLENCLKCPWGGGGGVWRGFPWRRENKSPCSPWQEQGAGLGAGPGARGSPQHRGISLATPQARRTLLQPSAPSGLPLCGWRGDTLAAPPPWGRPRASAAPGEDVGAPSDRVPAPPRARISSLDHLQLCGWGTPKIGEMEGSGDETKGQRFAKAEEAPPSSSQQPGLQEKKELGEEAGEGGGM
nr:uncharacterized protein LOC105873961 [Microcebus murinus]XP_012624782.1 uncharacterized protein LOC105873961 [Microcebus murinus]XP_012624783.1 uncharacterized protein LOC105873961 [Microcebus murinus]XP_012624784.1 uncharacterized protein LOC105873961 [Microcebus murinus]XP_012624785.1 uncharacterized protein LOC105873961 [Microcebus murinus]XP_012624786.1 uncharacterized protein LOC105873961 [Microcebus murinus]XP_020139484.1 uncharacterized protein LOC105873961 [Microcebus murinus]